MKAFEYAAPRTEAEALELLAEAPGSVEVLAGGTDLMGLMRKMIVTPRRVVYINDIPSLRGIQADSQQVTIGAVTTLDDLLAHPNLNQFPAITRAIRGINSPQLQSQGTLGGELCQRPQCWYFRGGHGLVEAADAVVRGDHRYHAILGNQGPAKFVHASRLAPALIALGARVRIIGPTSDDEQILPLAALYRTPRDAGQRETILAAGQLVTHVIVPREPALANATYEVRQSEGPDYPLAAAAAALRLEGGAVRQASIVMGHVAPVPWVSAAAARALMGQVVSPESARRAGEAAVAEATPLPDNLYKVQLARVAVERAVLLAAGLPHGGF